MTFRLEPYKGYVKEIVMIQKKVFLPLTVPLLLMGCAHKINLTPPLNTLDRQALAQSIKNVGYYISPEDKAKEVTTPGGGGDKVKYTTYADLEPALKHALDNLFADVHAVPAPDDAEFLSKNEISYIFTPSFVTDSSSSSLLTWPPTDFTIKMTCTANDPQGNTVWKSKIEGNGQAEFSEFKHDLSLSARRAAKNVFTKFEDEVSSSDVFK
jgi:hypothetical protein